VIAATHGKRAVDNLGHFKPSILPHEMDGEVQNFEESILFFADAYTLHGPGSRSSSVSEPVSSYLPRALPHTFRPPSPLSSGEATPELAASPPGSLASSRTSSFAALSSRRPSFASRLNGMLDMSVMQPPSTAATCHADAWIAEEDEDDVLTFEPEECKNKLPPSLLLPCLEEWQIEAARVDRCVRILPGVRKMLDSIPQGRYAVATSGAKTYGT
jgi:hypothetical protein